MVLEEANMSEKNFGTYIFRNVQPQQKTGILSPGVYTLSTLSNVPYVSVIGRNGKEKLFSWNELIEIEDGAVTVKNASFHPGDIVLNAGGDYAALPHRTSVTVELLTNVGAGYIYPAFWVDTRRARAVYVAIDGSSGQTPLVFTKYGDSIVSTVSPVQPNGANLPYGHFVYQSAETIPANTQLEPFALGFASHGMDWRAQALLDRGFFTLDNAGLSLGQNFAIYALEY